MLLEMARVWFEAACPAHAPLKDFLQSVESATEGGLDCWFHFGPNATRFGRPQLVYCFEGEFFSFQLNDQQAAVLGLSSGQVVFGQGGKRLSFGPRTRPPAVLAELQIEEATTEAVTGRVGYEMPLNHMLPSCLRMTWDRSDGRSVDMFRHLDSALMPVGEIDFRFRLPAPDKLPTHSQPVVLFFSLQSVPDGKNPAFGRLLSDIRAVLVELAVP
jgi:hypothetical protein